MIKRKIRTNKRQQTQAHRTAAEVEQAIAFVDTNGDRYPARLVDGELARIRDLLDTWAGYWTGIPCAPDPIRRILNRERTHRAGLACRGGSGTETGRIERLIRR